MFMKLQAWLCIIFVTAIALYDRIAYYGAAIRVPAVHRAAPRAPIKTSDMFAMAVNRKSGVATCYHVTCYGYRDSEQCFEAR